MKSIPIAPHCGVEIQGVALASCSDSEMEEVRQAIYTHGVAVFREQEFSPQDHISFAERWGGIDINRFFPKSDASPRIAEVRKEPEDKRAVGEGWHTDHSYDQVPAMGSVLVARILPKSGGDTMFAHMGAAYDSLSDGLKKTLEGLRAVHSADHIFGNDGVYESKEQAARFTGKDLKTRAVHDVVLRHPRTGRKLLYVNPTFTLHFEGWTTEESQPLLKYLYSVGERDDFHCRVKWEPGTVTIWDNRTSWHRAMNDYHGERRLMHRITLSGEPLPD